MNHLESLVEFIHTFNLKTRLVYKEKKISNWSYWLDIIEIYYFDIGIEPISIRDVIGIDIEVESINKIGLRVSPKVLNYKRELIEKVNLLNYSFYEFSNEENEFLRVHIKNNNSYSK